MSRAGIAPTTASLFTLAQVVGGEVRGDGSFEVRGLEILECAQEGELTFCDSLEMTYRWSHSLAGAALVPLDWPADHRPLILLPRGEIRTAFAQLVQYFRPPLPAPQPTPLAELQARYPLVSFGPDCVIHEGVTLAPYIKLGARCTLHPGVRVLAGCELGDDCTVHCNAVLHERTLLGHRCTIHACVVLGSHGFGYHTEAGQHIPQPQLGQVILGDDVEVGANSTIDRGTYGATRIGSGTKIDNQVQIAHNCQIGRANLICSQAGIAGSSQTGDNVVVAGQVGIKDHIRVGHRAVLMARSAISANVDDGTVMLGVPAFPEREAKLQLASIAKLPELRKSFKALQRQVADLQAALAEHLGEDLAREQEAEPNSERPAA